MNETSASKKESKDVIEAPAVDPFAAMVERVAANPDIDADKLQKILDMQMQVMDRQARDEFYDAMNRVQAALPVVFRDATNPQTSSRYSNLETIVKQIRPIYTAEGFSTSFTEAPCATDDYVTIAGTLRHRAGHAEEYSVSMPLDMTGIKGNVNKTRVHATGSTFTYGRRYLTCLMFDIATGDDVDGNVPDEPLAEEYRDKIKAALADLHPDDVQSFWKKARLEAGDLEGLLAHRYPSYCKWFTTKGVEL